MMLRLRERRCVHCCRLVICFAEPQLKLWPAVADDAVCDDCAMEREEDGRLHPLLRRYND
jgi:hypothetical protein